MKVLTPFENLICLRNRELSWKDCMFLSALEEQRLEKKVLEMDDHLVITFGGYKVDNELTKRDYIRNRKGNVSYHL